MAHQKIEVLEMGMFSWVCKGCGEEICEPEIAVVVDEEGVVCRGEYDGYGQLDGMEVDEGSNDPVMWHHKCYKEASEEAKADLTPSDHAPNQGMGRANPDFCSERDVQNIKEAIETEERKNKQWEEGKRFPCHNCHDNMVDGNHLHCGCCPDIDDDGFEYLSDLRTRYEKEFEDMASFSSTTNEDRKKSFAVEYFS
jgi:hypothetical protein